MLPFVPQPFPGEMLSSWLRRIAAEYGVSLERLTQHFGLSVWRPVQIDHASTRDDIERTATALSVTPAEIRAMVHRRLRRPFCIFVRDSGLSKSAPGAARTM